MKKSLYSICIALALAACSNTEDLIFEGSAADRLEQSKLEAKQKLTDKGGLWAMEYFSNADEPGYVMLFRFSPDGSVEVSGNHKWIPDARNKFTQETSLWTICSDNGTVLSFCTFNKVFHCFSDPNNITGIDAPVNENTGEDIKETGYGHEGDYEFQIMHVDSDDMMRLVGKKRGYNTYLYRLPADTDERAYLAEVKARSSQFFTSEFPRLIITDNASGERFVAYKEAKTDKMLVYPEAGDSITQTRTKHFIITREGIRFSSPFNVARANDTDFAISECTFTDANGLVGNEATFSTPYEGKFGQLLLDKNRSWEVEADAIGPKFLDEYNAMADEYKATSKKTLRKLVFGYSAADKNYWLRITETGGLTTPEIVRESTYGTDDNSFKAAIDLTRANTNGAKRLEQSAKLAALLQSLNTRTFIVTPTEALNPTRLLLTDANDPEYSFYLNIR